MRNYALGLDLGPSSIGWAAIEVDEQGNPTGIVQLQDGGKSHPAINSRIFPAGVENLGQGQKEETRNKKRRESRGARRALRRRRARKLRLIALLRQNDMLPDDDSKLAALQLSDPYELRKNALNSKIPLELQQIGRILLHFAKRRGFKSNRKDLTKDKDAGKINQARTEFQKALNGRTPGQFWYEQRKKDEREPIRNRRSQYKWIAEREQYEDELAEIWKTQQKHYPGKLTKVLHDEISKILFSQITYEVSNRKKRKIIGYCTLLRGKLRCDYSSRLAQEFRLLQKLNDLEVRRKGRKIQIDPDKRKTLYDKLMVSGEVKFKEVRKTLGLEERDKINFEFEGNEGLIGNEIDHQLTKKGLIDKKLWVNLDKVGREQIWQAVLSYFNDEQVSLQQTVETIQELSGVELEKPESINNISVPRKTVKFSTEAIERIVPHMREGFNLYQAINKAGFANKYKTLKKLPLPDKTGGYRMSNPNVKTVLFELRKLVNGIINEFGKPQKIIIEFTRDIRASKEVRQKILRQQSERRKLKERIKAELKELADWEGVEDIPAWAIEKYILWYEQKFHCPYSGKMIKQEQLFTRDVEIDHILPYSMSLDNSMSNKVVCFAKENQDKGKRTPFDWLGNDEERWKVVMGTIDHFNPQRKARGKRPTFKSSMDLKELATENKNKWQRFFISADQIDEIFWQPRLMPETGYVAREVRDYLKKLYPYKIAEQRVITTKGGITGELRKWWDLNRILGDGDQKQRTDLRHHALDAAVIACTSRAMIGKITNEIQKAWPKKRPSEISVSRPWGGFEDDLAEAISQVNVSHRVQRKVKGKLHKETHYWKEKNGPYKGKYITRKFVDGSFTKNFAEHICDAAIKDAVLKRLDEYDGDPKMAFTEPLYLSQKDDNQTPIRKVRVWKNSNTMRKIRGNVWVETGAKGANHHIEIFEYVEGKNKGKRGFDVVTTFDAVRRIKEGKRIIKSNHGQGTEFLYSLSINEMFMLEVGDGKQKLHRVQKMDQNGNIILRPHTFGGKLSDRDEKPLIQRSTFNALKGYKVTVDLLGRIRRAND
jgi:CRISPR-associated endonuclease Csn1